MPRLSFRIAVLCFLTAAFLFAWGVLTHSFPPVLGQSLMTAMGAGVGAVLLWIYVRPPLPKPGFGPAAIALMAASQVAYYLLVWTDAKQQGDLWRIWWGAAVPSLVAAHLRVMRMLEIDWTTRFGKITAAGICLHGLSWVLLVLRKDMMADPPKWYLAIMAAFGGTSVVCSLMVYYRYRKAHAGLLSVFPLWARWTAFGISQVVLVLAGFYIGRITGGDEAVFEAFPSALAGMSPEEIELSVRADAARLKTVTAGIDEVSARFPGLRARLEGAMKAERREYLKAPEDDDLRATYMTFLTYRSALLRHVAIYSGFEAVRDPALKARCFLVAYAAATALFESSGRLVVTFQTWSIARSKLNEPDSRWGISSGIFDRIAASVGSDSNVERFEEMAAYYEGRKSLWREDGVFPPEEMDWFEQRISKGIEAARALDVHSHRNWLRRVVSKVRSDAYSPVYVVQSQLSQWIGDTRVVARPPLIRAKQIGELRAKMQPGDIILERRNFFLSNAFLPGFWPHAVMYVGNEEELKAMGLLENADVKAKLEAWRKPCEDGNRHAVIEAVSEGVIFNSLEHSMHADFVAVLRPRVSKELKAAAIARAFAHEGKPYDYEFDFKTTDKLVCTELVYRSYEGTVHFMLQHVMGRDTLPAVEIARKFREERGASGQELDFVAFLDGRPSEGEAVFASEEEFCKSVDRPREFHE
ncbi:MAG: YiiX/YebB-like N1pC/P60 family cysteine hydrolase [Planctomycetota bacterium]